MTLLRRLRTPHLAPLITGVLPLALAACGSAGDAAVKPARLHAPPVTPDLVATRGERQLEYYQRQVLLINKWIKLTGFPPDAATTILDVVRQSREQSGRETSFNAGCRERAADVAQEQ